jgi:hypothetical protein
MGKVGEALLYMFAAWLVMGFALATIWLGILTGELASWLVEIPRAVVGGLILFVWLAVFPVVSHRRIRIRAAVGVLALPGAAILLLSFAYELRLLIAGRLHEPPIAMTYLLSPFVYSWGYYQLGRSGFNRRESADKPLQPPSRAGTTG